MNQNLEKLIEGLIKTLYPPVYPDGDTQLWCQWCGFRQTIKNNLYKNTIEPIAQTQQSYIKKK